MAATTSGGPLDPDGYVIQVDRGNGTGPRIAVNASVTLPDLVPGSHQVRLLDVATNCAVSGSNPRLVTVTADSEADAAFEIQCEPPPVGVIRVVTTSSGPVLDPDGYTVSLNPTAGHLPAIVGVNDSVAFGDLPPSQYLVSLSGLAPGCSTTGNPTTTLVTAADTARAEFPIHCVPPPVGAIDVITTGSGYPPGNPGGYTVTVDGGNAQHIGPNSTVRFSFVPIGAHTVALTHVPPWCGVLLPPFSGFPLLGPVLPQSVSVGIATVTRVTFAVFCLG